jgi:hypothetical protein
VPRTPFVVSGWVVEWLAVERWAYLPRRTWRLALEAALSPLESGNLDIRGHVEARHRGGLTAPGAAGPTDAALTFVGPYTGFAASLYIRVIDVHIFGRYEDMADSVLSDLPGRPGPGPRVFYGVKWSLWN